MKSKARFLPFVLALALLTSVFVLSSASAATGSVSLSESYTTLGGSLDITVSDPDLDEGVSQVNEGPYMIDAGAIAANDPVRFRTEKGQILNADDKLGVDYLDVVLTLMYQRFETTTGEYIDETPPQAMTDAWNALTSEGDDGARHPFTLENPQGGAFILRSSTDVMVPEGGIKFTVTYTAHDIQMHSVNVRSTQDPNGISVELTETGLSTGVFTGSFGVLAAAESDDANDMVAAIDGSLITVTYDDGGTSRIDTATVETTAPSIALIAPADGTATQVLTPRLIAEVTDADSGIDKDSIMFDVGEGATTSVVTTVPIAGGHRAEVQLSGVSQGETTVEWSVSVSDVAGNSNTSDASSIRIDTIPPSLASATTGNHLDGDGNAVADPAKADPTSIEVVFNEALDSESVQASDFRVNGVAPADLTSKGASVYLAVGAMAADAKPSVELVGDISDVAGNIRAGSGQVTAADGIAPTLTVTADPPYSKGEVTIDIQTDEALLTAPSLTLSGGNEGLSGLRRVANNHFRTTFNAPASAMKYSIDVEGTDTSANTGTADPTEFEVDAQLPAPNSVTFPGLDPVTDLGSGATHGITTQNPFITIEWESEASEYEGDSHGAVEVTGLMIADGDGNAVDLTVTNPSENRLLISARGLALGAYTMSFNGSDDNGNTLASDVSLKFEVKEPAPFSITLTPGWNLVSLPAEPQASGINDVIPADHPASIVLTYDPTQAGAWLSASRGGDGSFAGSLENISARTAYWIFTDAFDSLSVKVMQQTGGSPVNLPTVNLVAGWNLLPVLDVSGGSSFGDDATSVDDYVSGVVRTYAYDSSGDRFNQHSGMLQIGHGYWVYLSSATVLVP